MQKTSKKPQKSMGALAFCFTACNKYVFPVIDQMRNLFRFLDYVPSLGTATPKLPFELNAFDYQYIIYVPFVAGKNFGARCACVYVHRLHVDPSPSWSRTG